jgi:hypothetical protein
MEAHDAVSLWRLAAPEQVASHLTRAYGLAACVEALWRLNCPDSAQEDNRSFWLTVLDRLGVAGLAEVKLTPQIVAGFYAAHLDDPETQASVRALEAVEDGDGRNEAFWSAVANALLSSDNVSDSDGMSPVPCRHRRRQRGCPHRLTGEAWSASCCCALFAR